VPARAIAMAVMVEALTSGDGIKFADPSVDPG
jgi:hypothetical protein